MAERAARILFRFAWASGDITRLWLGAGPYVDADGLLWKGAALVDDSQLESLEQAINGEAPTISFGLSGVATDTAGRVWTFYQDGNLIESIVQVLIQPCDRVLRPVGTPRVLFTGRVDDVSFSDVVTGQGATATTTSTVTVQITNKFSLRRLANGAVLSDADQRARSAVLNPGAPADRFAERVPLIQNKTVVWPRFS